MELQLCDLKALSVLGRGAKGVVFLVRVSGDGTFGTFALKAISRSSIKHKKSIAGGGAGARTGGEGGDGDAYRRVWFERDVLLELSHPLLPSLRGVVCTEKIVGFAIERCSGGDLNSLRQRQSEKMFSDSVIRFYAAEIVLALEYLHNKGIVYRDLKPENILIQDNGHVMLVDFDLSTKLPAKTQISHKHHLPPPPPPPPPPTPPQKKKKKKRRFSPICCSCDSGVSPETTDETPSVAPPAPPRAAAAGGSPAKSNSFVGTEDYVAPEIIEGKGHDFAVDWWGLGVVLYEMLYGRTPFRGQNRKETFYRILTKDPELVGEQTPLRELIGRLLEKDPERRITCDGIKRHEYFRGVVWESVVGVARPPFIPSGAEWEIHEGDSESESETLDVEKLVQQVFGDETTREINGADGERDPSKIANFSGF